MEWSSFLNPQAGHRNTILVKIEQPDLPVMIMFKTKNFLPGPTKDRVLVTRYNSRTRFRDLDERFPLPFVFSAEGHTPARPTEEPRPAVNQPSTDIMATLRAMPRDLASSGSTRVSDQSFTSKGAMWPRKEINPRFIHDQFGFDANLAIDLPSRVGKLSRGHFFLKRASSRLPIKSFQEVNLAAGEERSIRLVIPPSEYPVRGRRKRFQVDYQMGSDRPVQYFIYLSH
jgi:hypothetical protein